MNIGFLNPTFLFALGAGVIPILIHRLTQRRARVKRFSAVRLLQQSQQNLVRPRRLKDLLLLTLRILAVMGLALLMARPVWLEPGVLALGEEGVKVLILDNSPSLGYQEERGTRFDLAKKAAREAIRNIKGKVILLPAALAEKADSQESLPWMEPREALRELEALPLSFLPANPGAALSRAFHQLRDRKGAKEILFITDLARGDWEGFNLSRVKNLSGEVALTFIRIGGGQRDANWAIKDVQQVQGEAVAGASSRWEVTVSNLSGQPGSTLVSLFLSGSKMEQKSLDLNPGEDGKIYFDLSWEKPGWVHGEVRLSGDRLPFDDAFYFPARVREKVKVLIVEGDPKTFHKGSESYYLVNALHPGDKEGTPFHTQVIPEAALASTDLNVYSALLLLNVAQPPPSRLASFLEAGKPLFIFLGSRVQADDYHGLPFFPWRLLEVRDAVTQGEPKIAQIDPGRKALQILSGPSSQSLKSASFYRYFKVGKSPKDLLVLGNKDPLLAEADWGKGKVFLCTSTANLEWNDLPLKAAFLPLIQGLLREAVGLHSEPLPSAVRFGETFGEKNQPPQLWGVPGGPGIYQFPSQGEEARRGVNFPKEESDLGKVALEELQKKFGTLTVNLVEFRAGESERPPLTQKELWPYVLGFLLMVLAAEMTLANRI